MNRPRLPGYTLTELLMVVAIVGILASIAPRLLINLENFFLLTTARNEIERDARASLDIMNRFIRQGVSSSIVIDTPSGQGPYSRIQFNLVNGSSVTFQQSGTELLETIGSDHTVLSRNLIYIAFTFPNSNVPTIVSISLTMGKAIQLGRRKVLELTIEQVRVMN